MKFLIVANGPFQSKAVISELASQDNTTIIALDGAADKLALLGVMPHAIIGDFDSIDKAYWGIEKTLHDHPDKDKNKDAAQPFYIGNHNVKIILSTSQYATDLEKGIKFADDSGAEIINIVCATGGRMDHSLGNIRFLRKHFKPNRLMRIYTDTQVLEYAKDQDVIIQGNIGDQCGIMAFPKATMSTRGLKYDTHIETENDSFELELGFSESISNELSQNTATIKIQGEALIIHPPLLKSQL